MNARNPQNFSMIYRHRTTRGTSPFTTYCKLKLLRNAVELKGNQRPTSFRCWCECTYRLMLRSAFPTMSTENCGGRIPRRKCKFAQVSPSSSSPGSGIPSVSRYGRKPGVWKSVPTIAAILATPTDVRWCSWTLVSTSFWACMSNRGASHLRGTVLEGSKAFNSGC